MNTMSSLQFRQYTPERSVQNYTLQRLTALEDGGVGYFHRSNSFSGRIKRYNGSEGYVSNSKPGLPDCFWYVRGKTYALEFKSPSGKQSAAQKESQKQLEAEGVEYVIINSPEAFEELYSTVIVGG